MDTTPSQPSDSQPKPTDDSAKPADTGAGTSGGAEEKFTSEKEIIGRWNELRAEIQRLYSRIAEHEQELAEHRLVSAAIEGMDPSRRCFRAVGGVLVERRIGEVVPAVARNAAALEAVRGLTSACGPWMSCRGGGLARRGARGEARGEAREAERGERSRAKRRERRKGCWWGRVLLAKRSDLKSTCAVLPACKCVSSSL
ncbi:unnamed protein product [Closterium sp. Yama58-4]|nr:unnamed protein product [Closterium sp. Yama58-4]